MVESSELAPLRVGASVDLAFEVRAAKRPLPFDSDAVRRLRVLDVSTKDRRWHLVEEVDGPAGPMVLVSNNSLSVGAEIDGTWMVTPDVSLSDPEWATRAIEARASISWLTVLLRSRLPLRIQESDMRVAHQAFADVEATRPLREADSIGYRVQFRTEPDAEGR